ncbi:MAG TPA: hypothetical protein PKN96_12480 [Flavobacterium sp.]|uniref:hypothetical protein n=1 Tax=Flavobacterium sp. TaxID=239 RepID=UPI002BB06382|nr:hypothetical protein [Flavobacterium sp.]HNP34101.1 hypothetical protein [Flavobacterium sp.]
MKSVKLISLAITMLFCVASMAQADTIKKNSPTQTTGIKHISSIKEYNEPLWVVDGEIVEEKVAKNIKPEIIESVKVMKDAAAIAVFGIKGAYGVILIKTRKLSKREIKKMKKKES